MKHFNLILKTNGQYWIVEKRDWLTHNELINLKSLGFTFTITYE